MEDKVIQVSLSDLRAVVISMVSDEKLNKITSKPQLIFKEACELYGENRIRKYIKSGLLKPVSQNGKGSCKYYSQKKINELIQNSYNHLPEIKL